MPEKGLFGKAREALSALRKPKDTELEAAARIINGEIMPKDREQYIIDQYFGYLQFSPDLAVQRLQIFNDMPQEKLDELIIDRAKQTAKTHASRISRG